MRNSCMVSRILLFTSWLVTKFQKHSVYVYIVRWAATKGQLDQFVEAQINQCLDPLLSNLFLTS